MKKKKKVCVDCKKKQVPQHHHERCHNCWEQLQIKRGNLTGSAYFYKSSKSGTIR